MIILNPAPFQLLYIPDSDASTSNSSYAIISPKPSTPSSTPPNQEEERNKEEDCIEKPPLPNEEERPSEDRRDGFITKGRSSSLIEIEEEITEHHVYVSSKFMSDQVTKQKKSILKQNYNY